MPEQELEVGMWVTDTFGNNIAKILRLETTKEFRQNAEVEVFDPVNPRIIIVDIRTMRPLRAPGEFKVGDKVRVSSEEPFYAGKVLTIRAMWPEYPVMHFHEIGARCRDIDDAKKYLSIITPVEARGEQKGEPCESQSANSADGSSSERESRTTPEGVTKAARGATQGSAQKNSENAKDKKTIEPSYFPPDVAEDEPEKPMPHVGDSVQYRDSFEVYCGIVTMVDLNTRRFYVDHPSLRNECIDFDAVWHIDHCPHVHETRAERIAKHFGGTGEPSVNRRNGTIGGR